VTLLLNTLGVATTSQYCSTFEVSLCEKALNEVNEIMPMVIIFFIVAILVVVNFYGKWVETVFLSGLVNFIKEAALCLK